MSSMAATDGHSARPRSRTMLSSDSKKSHKSRGSSGSHKLDLTETSKDKIKIHGKTDPSQAINEAQPAAVALEKPTIGNLRRSSYVGRDGQIITEADSSNPTRYRWERPLDTIKSFEEDISRTYREKQSNSDPTRPQSRGDMYSRATNRRSSYFGMYNQQSPSGFYGGGNENGADEYQQTPGNPVQNGHGPNNYGPNGPVSNGNGYGPNGNAYGPSANAYGQNGHNAYGPNGNAYGSAPMNRGAAPKYNRGYTEPMNGTNGDRQTYHNDHQSRETVGSMAPSPDTDVQPYSTNPSSLNSSMDQFGGGQYGGAAAPKYPTSAGPPPRVPMKLNTGVDQGDSFDEFQPKDKRKSWIRRRFSKE